uniref:Uncharacterized protein n=1 Tax=Candidatus Kentrum sp. LFY TaxID=2126342 RepID=A0A450UZN1_9GAMM|nr:MAG: hypothetical protein BECKLFY1418B_GA0070995_10906 [Candidatus Kentron sp. LFY]VFJ98018.1 MAG: hypothetical protein BECKLFY1418A_GA0070994_10779 [Candidatus Kentron sp. LFY]VFK20349.1 MAG: hypothetical protein BECKLFY1418C_GA0070996_10718 [Candidatus Kentron sp. LFY]
MTTKRPALQSKDILFSEPRREPSFEVVSKLANRLAAIIAMEACCMRITPFRPATDMDIVFLCLLKKNAPRRRRQVRQTGDGQM